MTRITVDKGWTVSPNLKSNQLGKLKPFPVSSVSIPELSSRDMIHSVHHLDITEDCVKQFVGRGYPIELFRLLINSMMNIGADITKDQWGNVKVVVETFYHMKRHIDEAIQTMIVRSFFTDLSFDDANEIVSRLKLEEYLYCFEGHESGVCLVVLGPNDRARNQYEQPWYLFQQEVLKFNASRTVFMTPEQEKSLIKGNEEFSRLVEFTSSFDKKTRQVVFKRENPTIHIIKQLLLVEKLEKECSEAKIALEKMVQLEEMLDLQRRMFPQ